MLKLKEEYKNTKVVKNIMDIGLVTFDTSKEPQSNYYHFLKLGFDFCFEPTEPQYKAPRKYIGLDQIPNKLEQDNKILLKEETTVIEAGSMEPASIREDKEDLVKPSIKKKRNAKKSNKA